jgi:hypothetical protein
MVSDDTSKVTTEKTSIPGCAQVTPRFIPSKPTHTVINAGQSHDRVIVRFVSTSGIVLEGNS